MPRSSVFCSNKPQNSSRVPSSSPSPLHISSALSSRVKPQHLGTARASPVQASPPPLLCPGTPRSHADCALCTRAPSASVTTHAVSARFPLPAGRMSLHLSRPGMLSVRISSATRSSWCLQLRSYNVHSHTVWSPGPAPRLARSWAALAAAMLPTGERALLFTEILSK